jgi:hypothetical protein
VRSFAALCRRRRRCCRCHSLSHMIFMLADGFGPSAATLAREVKAAAAGRSKQDAHLTPHVTRFASGRTDGDAALSLDSCIQGTIQTRSSDSAPNPHTRPIIRSMTHSVCRYHNRLCCRCNRVCQCHPNIQRGYRGHGAECQCRCPWCVLRPTHVTKTRAWRPC